MTLVHLTIRVHAPCRTQMISKHEKTLQCTSCGERASKRRPAVLQNLAPLPEPSPPQFIDEMPVLHSAFIGYSTTCKVGIAAITENMLKRKWSTIILRRLNSGVHDPVEIIKLEAGLSPKVISERLRTMHRYALVTRFPRPTGDIEYRVTIRGKKILEILNTISAVELQLDGETSQDHTSTQRISNAV